MINRLLMCISWMKANSTRSSWKNAWNFYLRGFPEGYTMEMQRYAIHLFHGKKCLGGFNYFDDAKAAARMHKSAMEAELKGKPHCPT